MQGDVRFRRPVTWVVEASFLWYELHAHPATSAPRFMHACLFSKAEAREGGECAGCSSPRIQQTRTRCRPRATAGWRHWVAKPKCVVKPEQKRQAWHLRGLLLDQASLAADLGGDVVVRQPSCGEKRNLLAARDGIHDIDCGNASLDHFLGIGALGRVDAGSINVQVSLRQHRWPTHSPHHPSHLFCPGHMQTVLAHDSRPSATAPCAAT